MDYYLILFLVCLLTIITTMITIIIPTKNRPKFLIDLVASIDRQKKGPLELIIVDQSNEYNADILLKNYIKYFIAYF